MAKRGQSGLCLVVGVDKPSGMTSHDVVSACRRIFGEKRVGHTGTLDPLASGVLPIAVGPATRLDAYMTGHDKSYEVRIVFGAGTDTDDADGRVVKTGEVPAEVFDPFFAEVVVKSFLGAQKQLPPVYSAIKVNGAKACDEARKGRIIDLAPRDIVVYDARLLAINGRDDECAPSWDVRFSVSAGTYIRALARDIGSKIGCPAHVGVLRRVKAGSVDISDCVTLETLAEIKERAALDPLMLLGYRFAYVEGELAQRVACGNVLAASSLSLCERRANSPQQQMCACTSGVRESCEAPEDGEIVSIVAENKLVALYEYNRASATYKARCVFQTGVDRGSSV